MFPLLNSVDFFRLFIHKQPIIYLKKIPHCSDIFENKLENERVRDTVASHIGDFRSHIFIVAEISFLSSA